LPEWKYIHTPGHSPGHISLYRESDGLLLAGDAFVTTCQESAFSVMLQKKELHGPPKYFTYNWKSAETSVKMLAALEPSIVATGHGKPMAGPQMREQLHQLANRFQKLAMPSYGRYLEEPALVNSQGVEYVPPSKNGRLLATIASIAAAGVASYLVVRNRRKLRWKL
jgi:glyoxylase-like metal-dependent hydrolase (beta-lactamase superfamily II)